MIKDLIVLTNVYIVSIAKIGKQALYEKLNGKYLKEAEELMRKRDYVQASEKFWGAAAEIIKAVAAKRGENIGTHKGVGRFILKLHNEHPVWHLLDLYAAAETLHVNFYEDNVPEELVKIRAEKVKDLVDKLKVLL